MIWLDLKWIFMEFNELYWLPLESTEPYHIPLWHPVGPEIKEKSDVILTFIQKSIFPASLAASQTHLNANIEPHASTGPELHRKPYSFSLFSRQIGKQWQLNLSHLLFMISIKYWVIWNLLTLDLLMGQLVFLGTMKIRELDLSQEMLITR